MFNKEEILRRIGEGQLLIMVGGEIFCVRGFHHTDQKIIAESVIEGKDRICLSNEEFNYATIMDFRDAFEAIKHLTKENDKLTLGVIEICKAADSLKEKV